MRKIRRFEKLGVPHVQRFWAKALNVIGIDIEPPEKEIDRIPKSGPVVVTANHPHGMVLAGLIGRVRTDYKTLTYSLLTGVGEIDEFMIPVPFSQEPAALEKSLKMRRCDMTHVKMVGLSHCFLRAWCLHQTDGSAR
ncbi:hypothetical protein [Shimia sp. NS0008-38b]|uniref:hypothetical protein n=1 Tax=Shimia sp. NS0008-38b TaxID=3127653 RepID=UPI003341A4A3